MYNRKNLLIFFRDNHINVKENNEFTVHEHLNEIYFYVKKIFKTEFKFEIKESKLFDNIYWGISIQLFEIIKLPLVNISNNLDSFISLGLNKYEKKIIFIELFNEYPEVERLFFNLLKNLVSNVNIFFENYYTYKFQIHDKFYVKGSLNNFQWSNSDFHNGNKSHIILTFSCGVKVIFKFKDDKCKSIIDTIISEIEILKHRKTSRLGFDNYYWEEFVEYIPLKSELDLPNYYIILGKYLGLFHILGVSDIINDNIICVNGQPVFIDLEFLLKPNLEFSEKEIFPQSTRYLSNSCISVGILPFLTVNLPDENGFDSGSFSHFKRHRNRIKILFNCSNRLEKVDSNEELKNLHFPIENGNKIMPSFYIDELIEGYNLMLNYLNINKARFIDLVFKTVKNINPKCRYLFRHTSTYELILRESMHPDYLVNRKYERVKFFNYLGSIDESNNIYQEIVKKEHEELLNLDIPIFYYSPLEKKIVIEDSSIDLFESSGIDVFFTKINSINDDFIKEHNKLIINAISCFYKIPSTKPQTFESLIDINEDINKDKILSIIIRIADEIVKESLVLDKNITWLDICSNRSSQWEVNLKKPGIYDGIDGIGIFFIYLYKITKDSKYKDIAFNILESSIHYFENEFNPEKKYYLFSPYNFPFSTIYFLFHYNKVTNDNVYCIDTLIRCKVKPYVILNSHNDKHIDFINGVSGLLSFLCDFLPYSKDKNTIEECIVVLKDKIYQSAIKTEKGIFWPVFKFEKLIGFSHGSSGIIYALSKYVNHSDDIKLKEIILDAINFNQTYFSQTTSNWIDLRYHDNRYLNASWCHGLTGMVISYINISQNINVSMDNINWDLVAKQIIQLGLKNNHCLCHGMFGNLEALISIGKYIKNQSLIETVVKYTYFESLKRGHNYNNWQNSFTNNKVFLNGLMVGNTGIAYGLLKTFWPETVPSVLTIEL